jgi:hypothetical protein
MVTFFNETETGYFESLHIKLYTENGRDKIWLKAKRINAHRKLDIYGKNKKTSKGKIQGKAHTVCGSLIYIFSLLRYPLVQNIYEIYFHNMEIVSDKD